MRAYLKGHTRPFSNPLRFHFLLLTIWQLVALWTGGLVDFAEGFVSGAGETESVSDVREFIATYFVAGLAGLVVVWTLMSRLVFLKSGLNLAEHAVFYLYLFGLYALYQCFVFAIIGLAGDSLWGLLLFGLSQLYWFGQVVVAAKGTFNYALVAGYSGVPGCGGGGAVCVCFNSDYWCCGRFEVKRALCIEEQRLKNTPAYTM